MPAKALPGAHIALLQQTLHPTGGQLDQFFIAEDGALWVAWVIGGGQWQPPHRISEPRLAPPGAPVAAAVRRTTVIVPSYERGEAGDAHDTDGKDGYEIVPVEEFFPEINVFFVGHNGAVYVAWVQGSGLWQGPVAISEPGTAPPGAHIKAAHQLSEVQLDVLFFGNQGELNVMWASGDKVGADGWHGPAAVSPKDVNLPGGAFAAIMQGEHQLDVVFIGTNEGLQVSWVVGMGAWQGPVTVSNTRIAPAGAGIAAAGQGPNQLSAFFVDHQGALNVSWVVGGGIWQGPVAITPRETAPAGAALATGYQGSPNQLDVLYVGSNQQLHVSWVEGLGTWQGPVGLGPSGIAPAGAPLATFPQTNTQLNAFCVGQDRFVYWVVNAGVWQGPVALPD
ncbi:hypothetical protein [Pseudoxanthomonas sacheonensis]|uniref:hypothetical protein n=1 Tax=Pseudoxanthomonas sacheonensis TaxID=443615 RepID=UPI0013D86D59|nr:hypothetical protein [Pseudoxanthomonas sacheonensis]